MTPHILALLGGVFGSIGPWAQAIRIWKRKSAVDFSYITLSCILGAFACSLAASWMLVQYSLFISMCIPGLGWATVFLLKSYLEYKGLFNGRIFSFGNFSWRGRWRQ